METEQKKKCLSGCSPVWIIHFYCKFLFSEVQIFKLLPLVKLEKNMQQWQYLVRKLNIIQEISQFDIYRDETVSICALFPGEYSNTISKNVYHLDWRQINYC